MEHKEHEGRYNYETRAVELWLDNDEGLYNLVRREWLQQAKDTPKNENWTREETTLFTLADIIKDFVEEENPLTDTTSSIGEVFITLMSAALSEVNWHEIAKAIVEDSNS